MFTSWYHIIFQCNYASIDPWDLKNDFFFSEFFLCLYFLHFVLGISCSSWSKLRLKYFDCHPPPSPHYPTQPRVFPHNLPSRLAARRLATVNQGSNKFIDDWHAHTHTSRVRRKYVLNWNESVYVMFFFSLRWIFKLLLTWTCVCACVSVYLCVWFVWTFVFMCVCLLDKSSPQSCHDSEKLFSIYISFFLLDWEYLANLLTANSSLDLRLSLSR